jgi:hypothetical protein
MREAMSKMDSHYERGYAKGLKDGKESVEGVDRLLERYNYLKKGGMWGVKPSLNAHLEGFRDALLTMGLEVEE